MTFITLFVQLVCSILYSQSVRRVWGANFNGWGLSPQAPPHLGLAAVFRCALERRKAIRQRPLASWWVRGSLAPPLKCASAIKGGVVKDTRVLVAPISDDFCRACWCK